MRALKIVTATMGVLIVAGTVLLAVLIIRRLTPPNRPATVAFLREPPGTRMVMLGGTSGGVAVLLQGGGPDRLVLLDPRTLHETARLTLAPRP